MRSADEIEAALQKLDPESVDLVHDMKEPLDGLAEVPEREMLFPAIFRFMEQNPEADFGSPGAHGLNSALQPAIDVPAAPQVEAAAVAGLLRSPGRGTELT